MTSSRPVEVFEPGPEDRDSWSAFVNDARSAEAAHLWEFHDLLATVFGSRIVRLAARRGDEWVGALPLVFQSSFVGRFLTSVPYLNHAGVAGTDAEARHLLAQAALAAADRLAADRLELRGRDGSDLPIETSDLKVDYVLELPATQPSSGTPSDPRFGPR